MVGRRVVCPDEVKGTVLTETPVSTGSHERGVVYVGVERDDKKITAYPLSDVRVIAPRVLTHDAAPDTRLGQLVAEFGRLRADAERYEALKREIKAAVPDVVGDVAWEDGDSVDVRAGAGLPELRVYPMSRRTVDVERMKAEYPEGYKYFLTRSSSIALKWLTK